MNKDTVEPMSDPAWPYNLPIWRAAHRAASPDGRIVAEIDPAYEVSMGNPTSGTLQLSTGLRLERCNPSFVWSEDSRRLAVPRYFDRLGLFRRQRMVVVDVVERRVFASQQFAGYYLPESFSAHLLVATKEPFHSAVRIEWKISEKMTVFDPVDVAWR